MATVSDAPAPGARVVSALAMLPLAEGQTPANETLVLSMAVVSCARMLACRGGLSSLEVLLTAGESLERPPLLRGIRLDLQCTLGDHPKLRPTGSNGALVWGFGFVTQSSRSQQKIACSAHLWPSAAFSIANESSEAAIDGSFLHTQAGAAYDTLRLEWLQVGFQSGLSDKFHCPRFC